MPRKDRIDAPSALHHVIVRGIERRKIFRSDYDRKNLLDRVVELILETQTDCFAWALLPKHAQFIVKDRFDHDLRIHKPSAHRIRGMVHKKYRRHGQLFLSEPEAL